MKKLAVIFMVLSFFIISCGGGDKGMTKDGGDTKMVASADASKIAGEWEATDLGDVLAGFGFATPAKLIFADGKYDWTVIIGGSEVKFTGTYKVYKAEGKPFFNIDWQQEMKGGKPNNEQSWGIYQFTSDGKMKIIFYRKAFLPRPEEFGDDDTQVYKRLK